MTADTKSAVLAELEAAAKAVCWKCGAGLETSEGHGEIYHYGTGLTTLCPASKIHRRIEELNREGA